VSRIIRINGSEREFADSSWPASIAHLLDRLGIDQATVVAEIDGQIVQRKDFAQTPLQEGQSIELIRFVGGG
jgi:thiamine biosynthesis protein ThiS